jgi:hypothetical protein
VRRDSGTFRWNLKDETEEKNDAMVLQHHKRAHLAPEDFLVIGRKNRIIFYGHFAARRTIREKVNWNARILTISNEDRSATHSEAVRGPNSKSCVRSKTGLAPSSQREIHSRNCGQEPAESENLHPEGKASPEMKSRCSGSKIEPKLAPTNASDSIRFNCEFDSNEIDENDLHDEKHFEPSVSTLRGITIDCNEVNENASDSIRFNCEFDSNEIDENDLHDEKHFEPRVSTLEGTTIDFNEVDENASLPMALTGREIPPNSTDEGRTIEEPDCNSTAIAKFPWRINRTPRNTTVALASEPIFWRFNVQRRPFTDTADCSGVEAFVVAVPSLSFKERQ